jgi:hypothetical protein
MLYGSAPLGCGVSFMTNIPDRVTFDVNTHRETGLKVAICKEVPGLVLHAHSDDELSRKIPLAVQSFIKATTGEETEWVLIDDEPIPGYSSLAYIAARACADA